MYKDMSDNILALVLVLWPILFWIVVIIGACAEVDDIIKGNKRND